MLADQTISLVGIDPGLVHTGIVHIKISIHPQMDRFFSTSNSAYLVNGKDGRRQRSPEEHAQIIRDTVNLWVDPVPGRNGVVLKTIEEYRPRGGYSTNNAMVALDQQLKHTMKDFDFISVAGAHKFVKPKLLELLNANQFSEVSHHQDLRSAARIAVYGALKDPAVNSILATMVKEYLRNESWYPTNKVVSTIV